MMLKEFKDFAIKGNLLDIAIGLVMATTFGTIVTAFVDGIFMPIIGKIFQVGDFANAEWVITPEVVGPDNKIIVAKSSIQYGHLISTIINFIIIAWVMFMIVKAANKYKLSSEPSTPSN